MKILVSTFFIIFITLNFYVAGRNTNDEEYLDSKGQCNCKNGNCEEDSNGRIICKCPRGFAFFTDSYCKKCDCGHGEISCTFNVSTTGVIKYCNCMTDFKNLNGKCKACPCKNGECRLVGKDLKCVCNPEHGLVEEGKCKACECGKNASCYFSKRQSGYVTYTTTHCLCPEGFEEFSGGCVDPETRDPCLSGPCENGATCTNDAAHAICSCPDRFYGEWCEIDACSPNPCQNGGICFPQKGIVKCLCEDPYTGENCEKNLCMPNPCENSGVCSAYNGSVTCSCIGPYIGERCQIGVTTPYQKKQTDGYSTMKTAENSKIFTDIFRHSTIKVSKSDPEFSTKESTTESVTRERTRHPDIFTPTLRTSTSKRFTITSAFTTENTVKTSSTTGPTNITNLCKENLCQNGGICQIEENRKKCYCRSPYSGKFCENDPCTLNQCKNGGKCRLRNEEFYCLCKQPHYGMFCEKDPCTENPCQNGGSCFVQGNAFVCICKQPYSGIKCEANPCSWNPCQNDGICKVKNGGMKCFCKEDFTGKNCEIRNNWYINRNFLMLAAFTIFIFTFGSLMFWSVCHCFQLSKVHR